jgi:glutaminyl-tRNA synthetase
VEENLDLFRRMRKGEFKDGEHVLRAKIDMAAANITMRDPTLYRIRHFHHHRTGDEWCIYPTYDFAHGQSDAIEGITHSICTLEFENHRPLYDWLIEHLPVPARPRQIEFARLNLTYTVMSKRKLLRLVKEGHVDGWNDPRMPTISGLRRRGYTPEAIRDFCNRIGVSKSNSTVDLALLEFSLREDLNVRAQRRMVVLEPLKVVITNYPEEKRETFEAENNPERPEEGSRMVPFGREIYIEREDFLEEAPKKWFRLAPGKEVRLKHAYFITCDEVIKDDNGEVVELRCSYDPDSRGGQSPDGRKVKGTLHWVSAREAIDVEARLYETLFSVENPDEAPEGGEFLDNLNPESLTVLPNAKAEPSLEGAKPGESYQFLRKAYFCVDTKYSKPDHLVFNRSVTLKDSWARVLRNKRENE